MDDLRLPRVLCLHGGGTSADILQVQMRAVSHRLRYTFRFVYVDGPFKSNPHPAIVPFFGDFGPFYRWIRWEESDPHDDRAAAKIRDCIRDAMDKDPGTGDFVGVLGFSQGAKIAASLLWAQEKVYGGEGPFKFGVIMAGRAPIVVLDPEAKLPETKHTVTPNEMSDYYVELPETNEGEHVVSTPTLHVHGLQDHGLEKHRNLVKFYHKTGTFKVVEWDGDHRLPIKADDVERVAKEWIKMAIDAGVLPKYAS